MPRITQFSESILTHFSQKLRVALLLALIVALASAAQPASATSPQAAALGGTADLTMIKTNNVGGATTVGNAWTWTVTMTNTGSGNAVFPDGSVMLRDQLPSTGATYSMSVNSGGAVGGFNCIQSIADFSCVAADAITPGVTLFPNGFIQMVITVTPTAAGVFNNPRAAGVCAADPNNVVTESNNANNACSNSVTVTTAPDLSVTKTNDVGGTTPLGSSWDWTFTMTNTGSADAFFPDGALLLNENLPSNLPYGYGANMTSSGATGSFNCVQSFLNYYCVVTDAITPGVTIIPGGYIQVVFTMVPGAAGTYTNPDPQGTCVGDPDNVVAESNENNNNCSDSVVVTEVLAASAVCRGENLLVTITAGDGPFDITGAAGGDGLPVIGAPLGVTTLAGPGVWDALTVTEQGGNQESLALGDVACRPILLDSEEGGAIGPQIIIGDPAISKSGSPLAATFGETVIWTITVSNPGQVAIPVVFVNDPIPDQFDVISATTTQGTTNINGQVVTVDIGTLNPGQTVAITITTVANENAPAGQVCNTATMGTARSNAACVTILPDALPPTGGASPLMAWLATYAPLLAAGLLVALGGWSLARRRAA